MFSGATSAHAVERIAGSDAVRGSIALGSIIILSAHSLLECARFLRFREDMLNETCEENR